VLDKFSEELVPNVECKINGRTIQQNKSTHQFILISDLDSLLVEISAKNYNNYFQLISRKDLPAIFKLNPKVNEIEEVSIIAQTNKNTDYLSHIQLTKREIEKLPTFLGENDPVKVIQLLPGVQSAVDGNGIFIRGGNNDQNLILYDDVPLYNISHLFGFFSVFNSNSIQNISVYKSAIPSNYGGRISSVIDVKSETGNLRNWKSETNLGLLATNINVQGPIRKDTSALNFSFRRTYVDLFQSLFSKNAELNATKYYFYDMNFNYFRKINSNNTISVSSFMGHDNFIYKDQWNLKNLFENTMDWSTRFIATKWEHHFNSKTSMMLMYALNEYDLNFGASIYNFTINLSSQNIDHISKMIFNYHPTKSLTIKYGLEATRHKISPNNFQIQGFKNAESYNNSIHLYSLESAGFITGSYMFSKKIDAEIGIRMSSFMQLGDFVRGIYDGYGNMLDSIQYRKNEVVKSYFYPEPRASINYHLSELSTFNIGFFQNYQYLHLAPISSLSLPTDIWIASSEQIKPQEGKQISIGFQQKLKNSPVQFSIETYYKQMNNLIEYKEGVMSLSSLNNNYDDNFFFGKGESYGLELFLKKQSGRFNGWLSYTLSKSTRTFAEIEDGRTYFAENDRRHNISLVLNYELSKKWALSAIFVYQSGNAITVPLSNYFIQGNIVNTYSPKNSFRLAPYHRSDISATYTYKETEKRTGSINFSIYNFYGRQNPFYYYFETSGNLDQLVFETKLKQVALISILPSISWKLKFK